MYAPLEPDVSSQDNANSFFILSDIKLDRAPVTPMQTFHLLTGAGIEGTVSYGGSGKPAPDVTVAAIPNFRHDPVSVVYLQHRCSWALSHRRSAGRPMPRIHHRGWDDGEILGRHTTR